MRLPRPSPSASRGSALLMSVLVLLVVVAITFQLSISASTDARVARNDVALTTMDLAIESALLEVYETLALDADQGAAGGETGPAGGTGPTGGGDPTGGAGGAGEEPAVDSREDQWGKPQRTEINEIELRILVQDEDSKLNLLGILTENEEEAEKHFERLVRVIDLFREGTSEDVDASAAQRMAEAIRLHLTERAKSVTPMPVLATFDEEQPDRGLPLTLKELEVLEPFDAGHFRDFRGERGEVVHSLGSFLTVWTSLSTQGNAGTGGGTGAQGEGGGAGDDGNGNPEQGGGADLGSDAEQGGAGGRGEQTGGMGGAGGHGGEGGQGGQGGQGGEGGSGGQGDTGGATAGGTSGIAVNVNTAPAAVLHALGDSRELPGRWWDRVIEYRNLEEEEPEGGAEEEEEPVYDEFGNEILKRRFFDDLRELEEVPGTTDLSPEARALLQQMLTTQSQVFSIYVTARRATGERDSFSGYLGTRREDEQEDMLGTSITRTVRSVVWRTQVGESTVIVPLVRWEVLDYTPFEVQDYPDADR